MKPKQTDWPLEVGDHVTVAVNLCVGHLHDYGDQPHIVIRNGTHGMVKHVVDRGVQVEFSGQLFHLSNTWAMENLSLFRRSQHSERRAEHDARRPK